MLVVVEHWRVTLLRQHRVVLIDTSICRFKEEVPVRRHDEAKGLHGSEMTFLRLLILRDQRRQAINQSYSVVQHDVLVTDILERPCVIVVSGIVALDLRAELVPDEESSKTNCRP